MARKPKQQQVEPPVVVVDESPADPDDLLDDVAIMLRAELRSLQKRQAIGGALSDDDFRRLMQLTDRVREVGEAKLTSEQSAFRQAAKLSEAELERALAEAEKAEREVS